MVRNGLESSGLEAAVLETVAGVGIDLTAPGWLHPVTLVLPTVVPNVPAVMLLLPVASHPDAGIIADAGVSGTLPSISDRPRLRADDPN